ncbi:hypothetical protein NM688_g7829 [Phlebia brevispora]|uniref:Uncharacterized protein n=1 Tax=Phlebia brevispora TaxID=194682 RepID=A0ACC1S0Y3_9APHY|nr:hypothetical protein NM688_g7829 [Phlebia brevispora]
MSLSSFLSSFLPTVYADAPEPKEEKPEEAAEEPAEEEEEEEPEDILPELQEECKQSAKCAAAAKHFAHCEEKVNAGQGYHGETCIEELPSDALRRQLRCTQTLRKAQVRSYRCLTLLFRNSNRRLVESSAHHTVVHDTYLLVIVLNFWWSMYRAGLRPASDTGATSRRSVIWGPMFDVQSTSTPPPSYLLSKSDLRPCFVDVTCDESALVYHVGSVVTSHKTLKELREAQGSHRTFVSNFIRYKHRILSRMESSALRDALDIIQAMFDNLYRLFFAVAFAATSTVTAVAQSLSSANGVYDTSTTPSSLPWNTYNYCNAPHVNAEHYTRPNVTGAKLVYMNAIIRHHKRTPDNLYPVESPLNPPAGWDCLDFQQFNAGGPDGADVFHETEIPPWHPFLSQIWNGSCDEGQLTRGGFNDAQKHGQDFWSVYSEKLGFLESVNENDIFVRTSVETRTMQVASALLVGMEPTLASKQFLVTTQPSPIDSIPPNYPCQKANDVRNAYQSVPAWTDHLEANQDLQDRLTTMLGVVGNTAWTSWYDHFFDTFTSRTCNGHPLPCNATGACVSNADALQVFSIGDFEYNYIWNTAENATIYNQLTIGILLQEFSMNFQNFRAGKETFKLRFFVGHDGTMIRVASAFGIGKLAPLRWPALGSEIVMEVWQSGKDHFVRVMFEGTPVSSLEWVTLDSFIDLLNSQIPDDLFNTCNSP